METIPLRTLVREPKKVKRLTSKGKPVQVTDNGRPLWIIRAVEEPEDPVKRAAAIDEILDEVLREAPSKISLSQLVLESRR